MVVAGVEVGSLGVKGILSELSEHVSYMREIRGTGIHTETKKNKI